MTPAQPPTIFSSFNARQLPHHEIARTFVPPAEFWSLARNTNSVLVGPRGSGKTTMLRMLDSQALGLWGGAEGSRLRSQIAYTGVYVPTDRLWGAQVQSLDLDADDFAFVSVAAFTDRVLECLARAMERRLAQDVVTCRRSDPRTIEAEIVARVAEAWILRFDIPSFKALIGALHRRQLELHTRLRSPTRRHRLSGSEWQSSVERTGALDFAQATVRAARAYNDAFDDGSAQWCLLLDEFELAGSPVAQTVFNALRSATESVLIKVSFAPHISVLPAGSVMSATAGHDYDFIALPSATGRANCAFAAALLSQHATSLGLPETDPQALLGADAFMNLESDTGHGHLLGRLERMTSDDQAFRDWSGSKGLLDANGRWGVGETERAALRRIAPLVRLRDSFLTYGGRQDRKPPTLWSGVPSALLLFDGNPRHFLSFATSVLNDVTPNGTVSATTQAYAIQAVHDRFVALLGTMSHADAPPRSSSSVLALVDVIGDYFARILYGVFTPDPPLTFVVDDDVPDDVLGLIELATNAGAIVRVGTDAATGPMLSVRGETFRLANILVPRYRLPMRLGRTVRLGIVLGAVRDSQQLLDD